MGALTKIYKLHPDLEQQFVDDTKRLFIDTTNAEADDIIMKWALTLIP